MIYFVDGFTFQKNPSPIGGGFTVLDQAGNLIERCEVRRYFTNNEGELLGIAYAVSKAEPGDEIRTDSQCAVAWVNNGRSKARPDLGELCAETRRVLENKGLELRWVRREDNLAGQFNEFGKVDK